MSKKLVSYIAKRLLLGFFTLILIISVTFFMMHALPSSPFLSEKTPPDVVKMLEELYGLDKPVPEQFLIYMRNAARLDFGESLYRRGRSVMSILVPKLAVSARIGLMAAGVALSVGIVLGALAALRRDRALDKVIQFISTLSVSLPSFVFGVLLLWIFGVVLRILPTRGVEPGGYIMPVITLAIYPCAYVTRLTRSSMLEVLGQDYIRTARAKGVSPGKVLFVHALKNALIPVITYAGPMLAYILTGSLVVEGVFNVGGIGQEFVSSINNSDYTMIMGTTIFLSVILIAMTLICDLLYRVVDKRIDFS